MYNIDFRKWNGALVTAIKLCAAARRVIGKGQSGYEETMDIERELREVAAEVQEVIKLAADDANRPLISG